DTCLHSPAFSPASTPPTPPPWTPSSTPARRAAQALACAGPSPTPSSPRRSSPAPAATTPSPRPRTARVPPPSRPKKAGCTSPTARSEEHTSELQSRFDLVCRLLLEKKKTSISHQHYIPRQ